MYCRLSPYSPVPSCLGYGTVADRPSACSLTRPIGHHCIFTSPCAAVYYTALPPPPPSQSISSPPQIVKAPPRHQAGVSCWGAERKSVYVGCGEGVTLPTYQFLCWMRGDAIETSNTETQWLPRCPLKCRAAFHPTYTLLRRWARGRPPSDLSVLVPDARRLHHSTYQFLRWM